MEARKYGTNPNEYGNFRKFYFAVGQKWIQRAVNNDYIGQLDTILKSYDLNIVKDIEFPDHYKYSKNDIEKIILDSKNHGYKIITTEKDFLRLNNIQTNNIEFIKSDLEILDKEEIIKTIIN